MASKGADADSPLPIEVWAEIQAVTGWLDRYEPSYRFVPRVGDILVKEHPPEPLRALRAIFEVYGERIKKELPDDLRGDDWVALCDPTVGIYVQTHHEWMVSRLRCYRFEHLHEIAARVVAKHNAATLAGAEQGGESTETETSKTPTALAGDEATATVNKMLGNARAWTWRETKAWLIKRRVAIHSRTTWRSVYKTDPPSMKGNLALVNEAELNKAIRDEVQIVNKAFDVMDTAVERKAAIRGQ